MSAPEPVIAFPLNFDFEAERRAARVGILEGAVAELTDGSRFPLCFVDLKRIEHEFSTSGKSSAHFIARPGLMVVSNITRWICTLAVRWAHSQDVFSELRSLPCAACPAAVTNVLFPADTVLEEAQQRGYLEDVVAELDNGMAHKVSLIVPIRLRKEIEIDAMNGRPFASVANLIVIADISRDLVNDAVQRLAADGYFSYSKPFHKP